MSIDRATLMAYADGELDEPRRSEVAQAIAGDPALAGQLADETALRQKLQAHFAAVEEEPLPAAWSAMIAAEAGTGDKVVTLDAARDARNQRLSLRGWGAGLAIAASLAFGLVLGVQLAGGGPVAEKDGVIIASGNLARTLDTQLASAQDGAQTRILASFRRKSGDYCRVFAGQSLAGIACREEPGWKLERLFAEKGAGTSEYRQAGSTEAELMASAQDMTTNEPLDAAQEAAARVRGWR